jgi:phytoene synthase
MYMEGFSLAEAITKKHAKTFYFASRLLTREKRLAAYAVYAICRISDDAVDNSKNLNLSALEERIEDAYRNTELDDKLLLAFRKTVNKYAIPKQYFNELIQGLNMDLEKARYSNFIELYEYCYKVAGVVGLIMLDIFGYSDDKAKNCALSLGIAMQLTNILRDIKEDYARGRIYLPQEEKDSFGVSEKDISQEIVSEKFKLLLKFQIARAREYYRKSEAGIKMLNNLNSRIVVLLMAKMYSAILNSIENIDYNIFSSRAHLNKLGKMKILSKTLLRGEYLCA